MERRKNMETIEGYRFSIDLDDHGMSRSLQVLAREATTLKRVMHANFEENMSIGNSFGALSDKVRDIKNATEAYRIAIEGAKRDMQDMPQHIREAREEYKKLKEEKKENTEEGKKLAAQIHDEEGKMLSLVNKQENYRNQISRLNRQLAEAKRQQALYNESLEKYRSVSAGAFNAMNSYDRMMEQMGLKSVTTGQKVKLLTNQHRLLSRQSELEVAQTKRLQNTLQSLQTKYNANASTMRRISNENKTTSDEYNKLAKTQTILRSQIARTTEDLQKQTAASAKTAGEVAKLRSTINSIGTGKLGSVARAFTNIDAKVRMSTSHTRAWANSLRGGLITAGIGMTTFGLGLGKAVQMSANLQQSWITTSNLLRFGAKNASEAASEVRKVGDMQRDATKFSKEYGYSQKDIADQYTELVKRGYSAGQSVGSMKSMLEAARASGDDYGDVVQNVSNVLDAFNLRQNKTSAQVISNSKRVTNAMAYAADMTATDFKSMGEAMHYVSASASQSGQSVESTTAALGELSNAGLEGSIAGTGLRKVLNSLLSPTDSATAALNKYGMTMDDFKTKKGALKQLPDIMKVINKHTENLSKADRGAFFKAVFGTTGQNAAMILSQSASKMQELVKAEEKAEKTNYVHQLAEKNMQSTQMQMKKLQMNIQDLAINLGNKLLPAVNKVAEGFGKWVASKQGQHSIENFSKAVEGFANGIAKHSNSILSFLGGFSDGLITVGKVAILPIKLIDSLTRSIAKVTGHSGAVSRFFGIVTGGIVGIIAVMKILHTAISGINAVRDDMKSIGILRSTSSQLETQNSLYERMIQLQEHSLEISEAQARQQGINTENLGKTTATENAENIASNIPNSEKKVATNKSVQIQPYLDETKTSRVGNWFKNKLPSFGAKGGEMAGTKVSTGFLSKFRALPEMVKGTGIFSKIMTIGMNAFAAFDMAKGIMNSLTDSKARGRYKSAGKVMAEGIGMYLGGPMTSQIAGFATDWAYTIVDNFKKGWNGYTKGYKPKGITATIGWDFKNATRQYNNFIAGIEKKHPKVAAVFRWVRGVWTTSFAEVKFFIRNMHNVFKMAADAISDIFKGRWGQIIKDWHKDNDNLTKGIKSDWKGFFDWFGKNRHKVALHKPTKSQSKETSSKKSSVKSLGNTRYSSTDVKNLKSMTSQIGSYEKALKGLKSVIKSNDPTSELRHMNKELKGASSNWGKVAKPIKKIGDAFKYLSKFSNSMSKKDAFAALNKDLPNLDNTIKKYGKSLTKNINSLGKTLNKNHLQKPLAKLDKQIKTSTKTWKGFSTPVKSLAKSFKILQNATKTMTGKKGLEALTKGFKDLNNGLKKQTIGKNLKNLSKEITKSKIVKSITSMDKSIKSSAKYWKSLAKPIQVAAKSFNTLQKSVKNLDGKKSGFTQLNKDIKTLTTTLRKNNFGKMIADQANIANKAMSGKKSGFVNEFNRQTKSMNRALNSFRRTFEKDWKATWTNLDNPVRRNLSEAYKSEINHLDSMENKRSKFSSSFLKGWNSWIDSVVNNFRKGFSKLPNYAESAMKDIVSRLNKGINGVNKVISDFDGDKKLSAISYANGTKGGHPGGHMLVNDSNRPHWKELVKFPGKDWTMFDQKNVLIPNAPQGTTVINGEATHKIMSSVGISHYADGTDDSDEIVEKLEKNPLATLKSIFFKSTSFSGSPVVTDLGTAIAYGFLNAIKDKMKEMAKDAEDANSPAGTMSKSAFRKAAERAAASMHQSLSAGDIARLYWQAMVESTVNPAQGGGIDDHDGTGRPIGLFQFKLSTWNAAVRAMGGRHRNIHSAVDQIAAVLADRTWRSDLAPIGTRRGWTPHGYANGGIVSMNQLVNVAEGNMPEAIIPWDINKRPRALNIINQTLDHMERDGGGTGNIKRISNENDDKFKDNVIALLGQIAGFSKQQIDAILANGGNDDIRSRHARQRFYQQYGNDQRVSDYMSY